jgi:hemerythrin superfamily protein
MNHPKTHTPPSGTSSGDAIDMLVADHKKVLELFSRFAKATAGPDKADLVARICRELTVHMQLEEEIFYPAVKAALHDHELVPEGEVEHEAVRNLIRQVEGAQPQGEKYDARVKVMGEFIEHHAREEEQEMFPKARKTALDMADLGSRMAARKQELAGQS